MSNKSDIRTRKYQLTINNPLEHGFTHSKINECMRKINWIYYCFCDEIGIEEHTPHTHLYFESENAIHFSTVKKLFPMAHIEIVNGTAQNNRDYIRKEGRYLNSDKRETNLPETFEEYGKMPLDKISKNLKISEEVLEMLENESNISEIIKKYPSYTTKTSQLEKARQVLLEEKHNNEWRNLEKNSLCYGNIRLFKCL